MSKIADVLMDPNKWIDAFIENTTDDETIKSILNFIKNQKLSQAVSVKKDNKRSFINFTFEYEDFEDLPKEIKENVVFTPYTLVHIRYPTISFCNIKAKMILFDLSEKSYYPYEYFMHSLTDSSKKYICVNIEIY